MKTTPTRSFLLALALAAVALPGFAAKTAEVLSSYGITSWHNSDGSAMQSNGGGGNGNPSRLFNGTFGDYQMLPRCYNNGYVIIDLAQREDCPENGFFVTEIIVDTTGTKPFSIYTSANGVDNWTAVEGAVSVTSIGKTSYAVGSIAKSVKYVFNEGGNGSFSNEFIAEIQVLGYDPTPPPAQIISSYGITSWHNSDGSAMQSNGGGGNGNPSRLFNGTFGDYQMLPRCYNNGYVIIDLTQNADCPENGYYVTEIIVDTTGTKSFSIYTSANGVDNWTAVEGAVSATSIGKTSYAVGSVAKSVKYVFNEGGNGSFSNEFIAEIQVLGIDPTDIACLHPSWTEWAIVANSATCTEKGIEERFCTVCRERQTKASEAPPLGHDYVTTLTKAGSVNGYGSGSIACSRCNFSIDFPHPVAISTIGSRKVEGKIQFADFVVSSEKHPEWGPVLENLFDKKISSYWFAETLDHNAEYVRFEFGEALDLTKVELAVLNHDQVVEFYNLEDGTETLLKSCSITRDDSGSDYQEKTVSFWSDDTNGCRVKTLVVRFQDETGLYVGGWGQAGIAICELRPYGTVVGAGMPTPTPVFILMQ